MIRRYTHYTCDMPECSAFYDTGDEKPSGWLPARWASLGLTQFIDAPRVDVAIVCERCVTLLFEAGTRKADEGQR